MNKTEAAQFLGVSVRAVERYVSAGRLAARYERGKTGQVLAFERSELERFKAELETPVEKPRQDAALALAKPDGALAKANQSGAIAILARLLETMPSGAASPDRPRASVPVADKLLLSLDEAQALTGLSRSTLRAAIDAGDLQARIIGKGWKVKRADLESYIEKL